MKSPLHLAILVICGISLSLGQSEKEPATVGKAPEVAKPAKLNLVRYKGKTGKPSTNVKVSTRAGDLSAIRIVAIAPGNDGVTFKPQPRFWWHQNHSTEAGELEFVLTRLGSSAPSEILRRPIPKMKAGYNLIDLASRNVNPGSVTMESGTTYQWTINLRSGVTSSPVYSQLTLQNDPNLAASPVIEERLGILGEQGNWYELFDLVCSDAEKEVPTGAMYSLRNKLLTQIKLIGEIK